MAVPFAITYGGVHRRLAFFSTYKAVASYRVVVTQHLRIDGPKAIMTEWPLVDLPLWYGDGAEKMRRRSCP